MNLDPVILAIILGGVFGGLGASLGVLAARIFSKKSQTFFIATFAALGVAISQWIVDGRATESRISTLDQELQREPFFVLIARDFPDEYKQFLSDISDASTEADAFDMGHQFTSRLRMENANHVRSASTQKLVAQLEHDKHLYTAIRAREGDAVCSSFLTKGLSALSEGIDPYQDLFANSSEALFLAIADGKKNESLRAPHPKPIGRNFWSSGRRMAHQTT